MPTQFHPITFSLSKAEAELETFKAWFARQSYVGEKAIVSELRCRPQMCALLASVGAIQAPDLIRFELNLKGLFRTDLVVGHNETRRFVLIEFEDAKQDSIFSRGTAQYRYWARRLEHGIGQVIDWAWLRADHPSEIVLTTAFGGIINYSAYLVICGRDTSIADGMERGRFEFRRNKMAVEGTRLQILTYDGMVKAMEEQLATGKSFAISHKPGRSTK